MHGFFFPIELSPFDVGKRRPLEESRGKSVTLDTGVRDIEPRLVSMTI